MGIKKGSLIKWVVGHKSYQSDGDVLIGLDPIYKHGIVMANMYFSGDKQGKQAAINSLTLKVSEYFGGRYEVQVVSDGGGQLLEIQIEVSKPFADLSDQLPDFPVDEVVPKWNGWRVVLLKVPHSYIDSITLSSAGDDY